MAFSPVKYDKKVLEMIGRKLKKNSVALDVVNFGEEDDDKTEKLQALVSAVNNNDSSHIVHVPAGANALSDVLIRLVTAEIFNCSNKFQLPDLLFLTVPLYLLVMEKGEVVSQRQQQQLQLVVYLALILMWIPMWILNLLLPLECQWRKRGLGKKKLLRRLRKKVHSQKKQENKHQPHKM